MVVRVVVGSHNPAGLRQAVAVRTGRAGRRCLEVEEAWDSSGRHTYNWEGGPVGFEGSWGDWRLKQLKAAGDW